MPPPTPPPSLSQQQVLVCLSKTNILNNKASVVAPLKQAGCQVECVYRVEDTVKCLQDAPYDIFIADYAIAHEFDGAFMMERTIAGNWMGIAKTKILLTTTQQLAFAEKDYGPKADAYLNKPFSIDELLNTIYSIQRNKQTLTSLCGAIERGDMERTFTIAAISMQNHLQLASAILDMLLNCPLTKATAQWGLEFVRKTQEFCQAGSDAYLKNIFIKGVLFMRIAEYDEAIELFRSIITAKEAHTCYDAIYYWTFDYWSQCLQKQQKPQLALKILRNAVQAPAKQTPSSSSSNQTSMPLAPIRLHLHLSRLATAHNDGETIEASLTDLVIGRSRPEDLKPEQCMALATALLARMDQYPKNSFKYSDAGRKALQVLRELKQADKQDMIASFLKDYAIYQRLDWQDLAKQSVSDAKQKYYKLEGEVDDDLSVELANSLIEMGDHSAAQTILKTVDQEDLPAINVFELNKQGLLAYRKGDFAEAIQFFKQAMHQENVQPYVIVNLLQTLLEGIKLGKMEGIEHFHECQWLMDEYQQFENIDKQVNQTRYQRFLTLQALSHTLFDITQP